MFIDAFVKACLMSYVHIRWAYFHVSPSYMKFGIDKEAHFQNIKTGEVVSNYIWED